MLSGIEFVYTKLHLGKKRLYFKFYIKNNQLGDVS